MAWYLNYSFVDANKFITASIPASTSNAGLPLQIEWEIEFEARKNGTEFIIASTAFNTTSTLFFIRSGTDFELRSPSNSNWLVTTGVTLTNFNVFKIRSTFDGTTRLQTLSINGTTIATRSPTTAAIGEMASFFGLNSNSNRHGDFKYFKFTDFVTPANNRLYDANASGGSGTILPETIGGFNGNQSGTWPADNSEWVFYSSGSAYSDILSGVTFTSSVGSLTSTRAKADTLSGASYSSSVGNLTATKGYTSTLSSISFTSSVGSLTASRGYSSVLNASTYSSAIGSLTSTTTSASGYDSLLAGLLYTSSLGEMMSTVQRASVLNGIAFNSSIGSMTAGLGYNSTLSGAVYSSSIGALTSTRSGEVTVTIEGYTIKFADSAIAAAYAKNGISAGYAADILEITWQH